jgi:sulfatase modifying factor 1
MASKPRANCLRPGAVTLAAAVVYGVVFGFALSVALLATETHAGPIVIDWVTVGDPGNAGQTQTYDPGGPLTFGAVTAEYRIAKHLVTIQQYTDFLNAVAATDPYSLYQEFLIGSDQNVAGISQSGTSGGYTYSVIGPSGATPAGASSPGNRPITYVSWFAAARFANWMHNGQGSGSTETGAYTLVDGQTSGTAPARNPGALFYIPTENEWYKAAYYKGGGIDAGYWAYATQSDAAPGNVIGSGTNQANYEMPSGYSVTQSAAFSSSQNYLTDVGAFTDSASFYGTFDQSGNVFEWNDLDGTADASRGLRGGSWNRAASSLSSSIRSEVPANFDGNNIGFRLASPVPEPATLGMASGGALCAGGWWVLKRRRRTRPVPGAKKGLSRG